MSDNICNDCNYSNKNGNEKPCSTCMIWIDGHLEATNYEPKVEGKNMYKLKFRALQCDKRINKFMQSVDLLQEGCGIGIETFMIITTETNPTEDYIHKIEKHIEKIDIDNVQFMSVKCVSINIELKDR